MYRVHRENDYNYCTEFVSIFSTHPVCIDIKLEENHSKINFEGPLTLVPCLKYIVWPLWSLLLDFQVKFKLTTTLFCINRHMCRNAVGDGLVLEILLHFSSSIHSMLDWSLTMNWKCKPFFLLTCHSWRFVPTRPVWNDTITKLKLFFWAKIWNVVSIQHLTPMKILGAWTSKLRTNNRPFWQEIVCVPLWTLCGKSSLWLEIKTL